MLSRNPSPPRVLCLVLRSGSIGHVVLDGFGVAERSFFTSRVDHLPPAARFAWMAALVTHSCARYRPTRVVLGLPGRLHADRLTLAEHLLRHLRGARLHASVKRLSEAARVLVGHVQYRMADEIVDHLVAHFVPDLAPRHTRGNPLAWYWRPAWCALAIALAELVEHHPLVAAALARPSAFSLRSFRAALAAAGARIPAPSV